MNDEQTIRLDRMRYAKNTFSANFALLAILFDVFFFISLYETDVGSYYYNILMGASIVYNLIFMLAAFLSSEGIKNYDIKYAYVMAVLGVIQVIRIFIYPIRAHAAKVEVQGQTLSAMKNGQFLFLVACLLISAACLFVGAVVGISRSRSLTEYRKTIGEV